MENRNTISTPAATVRRSGQRGANTTANGGESNKNSSPTPVATLMHNETMCFIPPPFIVKLHFDGIPNNPLELILAAKAAAINFNNTHSSVVGFENVDATIQAKHLALWAFEVYKGHIKETSFDIDLDNNKIVKHHNERHTKCIIPPLATASSTPASLGNHLSIFEQLGAGLNCMGEANKTANL